MPTSVQAAHNPAMTTEPQANATGRAPRTATSWATGLARFAGLAMALLGVMYIVAGTSAPRSPALGDIASHEIPKENVAWAH
jgi:hypothetical protein